MGPACGLLSRVLLVSAMLFPAAASALVLDTCSFAPPGPVLQPNAYPRQTLDQLDKHSLKENATPRPGLDIEIRQDGCEDFIGTRLVLTVAQGRERERSDDEWIAYARAEIAGLKTREPNRFSELDAFLAKASRIAPRKGERALCRDGSAEDVCSWENLGGYTISIKRGRNATTISVIEQISA